jgi:hypothetical protein
MENIINKLLYYKDIIDIEEELSKGDYTNFYHSVSTKRHIKPFRTYRAMKRHIYQDGKKVSGISFCLGDAKKANHIKPSEELVNKIWNRWLVWKEKREIDTQKIKNTIRNIEEVM